MKSCSWVLVLLAVSALAVSSKLQSKPSRTTHKEQVSVSKKRVLVPVHHGFEEIELVTIVDVLRRAGAQVTVASVHSDELELVGMLKMRIVADAYFERVKDLEFDLIVSPGGSQNSRGLGSNPSVVEAFRRQKKSGRWFATICASTKLLLEDNGLLEDLQATGYPSLALSSGTQAAGSVVVSRNLITSRGPGTALEFALKLVEHLISRDKAVQLSSDLLASVDL